MSEFASAPYTAGQLNAMVKKLKDMAGEDGPEKFLRGDLILKAVDLLKQVAIKSVSATTKFVTKDHFKVDTSAKAKVKISYLGDNFKKNLLNKIEENIPAAELVISALSKPSLDAPILAELGDRAETTLAYLWELLTTQGHGQSGPLLTNGNWNIFYTKDAKGKTWAVGADWYADGDGWRVVAYPTDNPVRWSAGFRVVSRK